MAEKLCELKQKGGGNGPSNLIAMIASTSGVHYMMTSIDREFKQSVNAVTVSSSGVTVEWTGTADILKYMTTTFNSTIEYNGLSIDLSANVRTEVNINLNRNSFIVLVYEK